MIGGYQAGMMRLHDKNDKLRAYYIRQLRASDFDGNAGGWVYPPTGKPVMGWSVILERLARSMDVFAHSLSQEATS
jgi:hypothetical protein